MLNLLSHSHLNDLNIMKEKQDIYRERIFLVRTSPLRPDFLLTVVRR